ncbi:MAG: hypothetical protein K2H15_03545, partial [Muribaculaceae bacterium]|nr:hypothetical protein [Muribaculaceae bacterium]
YPLLPLEWKVIQYCVRYGFCTFCIDENTMRPLSVFQYVEEELAGDGTAFSVPEFDEIFGIIRNLIPQYETDLSDFLANLEEKKTVKRNEGFREIGENYSTTADIQRAEQRLEEKLDEWEFDEKEEFSKAYIAKELSNHEMDSIRKFAVEALMERHQLSNIYSREMPAQREEDRLYRLLPAALSVWKNGIIDMTIKNLFSRLQEIAGKGNLQEEQDLQLQLARLLKERSEIAKNIGDRILSPPRGKS